MFCDEDRHGNPLKVCAEGGMGGGGVCTYNAVLLGLPHLGQANAGGPVHSTVLINKSNVAFLSFFRKRKSKSCYSV